MKISKITSAECEKYW